MDRRFTIQFTFKSGTKTYSKEFKSTPYQYKKFTFLMTSAKTKYVLKEILQRSKTDLTLGIVTSCLTVEFVSEYHESDFETWTEGCIATTERCFHDVELLLVKGRSDELHHIQRELNKSQLAGDGSLSVFTMKDVDGVFLLSSVDCLISLMLELQKQFQTISFWKPERDEEVQLNVLNLTTIQCRLNAIFKGTEKMKTLFPNIKICVNENETVLGILGNQNDTSAATEYFNNFSWMEGVPRDFCQWAEGFQSYMARENVQIFIDRNITTQDGTWIIDMHGKHGNSLVVFGKTEEDVKYIQKSLIESVRKFEFFVIDKPVMAEFVNICKTQAEYLEKLYDGKFLFYIDVVKYPGVLVLTFVFTADLENETSLKMHLEDLHSNKKVSLSKSVKEIEWLRQFYRDDLIAAAESSGVILKFQKDTSSVELEGNLTALGELIKVVDAICMKDEHILLPLKALPEEVVDFFKVYRCSFEYIKAENCKFFITGKIGIVAISSQSGFDNINVQVRVKVVQGDHSDPYIQWFDESCANVKCPILEDGDKGDVLLLDGGLKLLFQRVKEMRKMSVAFDMHELSSRQTHLFLQSILDQVVDLPVGLIILLHILDDAMFQTTAEYLQQLETYPTYGLEQGRQRKQIMVRVIQGKIAELPNEVDVIVNTSSPDLDITRGAVSRSILKAAGGELKNEIAQISAIKQGSQRIRVEYGEVVETFGYRLKCQRIFHGTLYKWTDDKTKSQDVLQRFVKKCISLADERKFKTLAFPAIGTGHLQIPPDVVGSCVKKVVEEYSMSHPLTSVEEIIFVIYEMDIGILQKFKDILETNKDVVGEVVPPTLYRFSVFGEMHNIVGAMNLLTGLFREHIITSTKSRGFQNQKKTRAREEKEFKVNTNHRQENTQLEETRDKKTKNEEINSHEDASNVSTTSGLLERTNQSAPDDYDERCLLLQSKNNMTLSENTLGPILKDVACDVVCPFFKDCCALIMFKTTKDSYKFFPMLANESFDVKKLPKQEVKNTKAKLGPKVIGVLETRNMSSQEFYRKTGGTLCIQTWTVTGNLLVLQHVQKFLKDLVEEFDRSTTPKTLTMNLGDYLTGVYI